jgi:hypothetical protein
VIFRSLSSKQDCLLSSCGIVTEQYEGLRIDYQTTIPGQEIIDKVIQYSDTSYLDRKSLPLYHCILELEQSEKSHQFSTLSYIENTSTQGLVPSSPPILSCIFPFLLMSENEPKRGMDDLEFDLFLQQMISEFCAQNSRCFEGTR